jgi:hypothetical protein
MDVLERDGIETPSEEALPHPGWPLYGHAAVELPVAVGVGEGTLLEFVSHEVV